MAIAVGSKSALVYIEESTLGTLPTSATYTSVPFRNETLGQSIENVLAEDIRSDRQRPEIRGGNKAVAGDITTDFGCVRDALMMRHLLASAVPSGGNLVTLSPAALADATAYKLGDVVAGVNNDYICVKPGTTSGEDVTDLAGAAGVAPSNIDLSTTRWHKLGISGIDSTDAAYRHVLVGGIDFPSVGLSFEKQIKGGDANKFIKLSGCRMNRMTINVQQNTGISVTWNVLGTTPADGSTSAASSVTAVNDRMITGHETLLGIGLTLDAAKAAVRPMRSGSITVDNQCDPNVYVCGERFRDAIPEGTRLINGSFETFFKNSTEFDYFANETELALVFFFYTGGHARYVELPKVKLTGDGTPKIPGQGVITGTFQFDAYTDGSNDIKIHMINSDSDMFA